MGFFWKVNRIGGHQSLHLWKELNKFLLLIIRPGTVADLDGHVSPLQRQLGSFSPSQRACLFSRVSFLLQVLPRKCHCGFLAAPGFGLVKERGRGGGENLEELVWFLPGCKYERHRPIRLCRWHFGPIMRQVLPCDVSRPRVQWIFINLDCQAIYWESLMLLPIAKVPYLYCLWLLGFNTPDSFLTSRLDQVTFFISDLTQSTDRRVPFFSTEQDILKVRDI